ncbi:hypothetical protein KCU67_g6805, partial [Aureobasidium melanogenum]
MGEISDLRAQILDNLQTLRSDFNTNARFILTCNEDDGSEKWTLHLREPIHGQPGCCSASYGKGKGENPQAAYKDLLKKTALELDTHTYLRILS